jgi:hypothetical protein
MTGPMIAEHLGLPCINNVVSAQFMPGGLYVKTSADGICMAGEVTGKAMLLAGNSEHGLLRIPTLSAIRSVKGKQAELIQVSAPAYSGAVPVSITRPAARCQCRFLDGDATAQASAVLDIFIGGAA